MKTQIAVVDYGSQYSQLIVRRIREIGYYSKLFQPSDLRAASESSAVILSGGPRSVTEPNAPDVDIARLRDMSVPVLGICYGMQILHTKWGGKVESGTSREYGPAGVRVESDDTLFKGIGPDIRVWMSHSDIAASCPPGSLVLARNADGHPVAIRWSPLFYGIQFHPEVSHTEFGVDILKNFLSLMKRPPDFSMDSYKDELVRTIGKIAAGRHIVCAVSGGVDSTVLAALIKESGTPMRPIFVDNGLLRKNEVAEVTQNFQKIGIGIECIPAADRFVAALKGIDDPEHKRRIIGDMFVQIFHEAAGDIELLAQGTLYPDVIESATGGSGITSRIKTHHNRVDKIIELAKQGKVIEPLSDLFKDEVRQLGVALGIPADILNRHPFPGPGLAVRIPGAISSDKLGTLREADDILIRILKQSGWYDRTWQALCVLLPVKTVGVKGDERSFEYALSVRCVTSRDAMTADVAEIPYPVLREISNTILNKVRGINRVLFDISTKPPAGIEWE